MSTTKLFKGLFVINGIWYLKILGVLEEFPAKSAGFYESLWNLLKQLH